MSGEFMQLILNPGSTSTKIAVFRDDSPVFTKTLRHSTEELASFQKAADQFLFRKELVLEALKENVVSPSFDAVVGRGGLLKPLASGTYKVNELMVADLKTERYGSHASNLGALIAFDLAETYEIPAFVVDPVVVDEMQPIARITGIPDLPRLSRFHALNQKAVARRACAERGFDYNKVSLIVAHLGGGITIGAHFRGRVIDVNDALAGDGPFSPERCGRLPVKLFMELCYSGKYSEAQMDDKLVGRGGLAAHLGTNNGNEVENRIAEGDDHARLIYRALAYNIAKEIGSCAAVFGSHPDGIIITGGMAYSSMLVEWIRERIAFLAPVYVYPGEDEMEALALGGLRVLRGEEAARVYGNGCHNPDLVC